MFEPLLNASLQIQIHAGAAAVSLFLGPFVLFRKRRDRIHKGVGYVWVSAMAITALSSLFIFELRMFGLFSPIHLLSLLTIGSLIAGVGFAIRGRISAHRKTMQSLYFLSLGVAGLFTFMPGRILNRVFFTGFETAGFTGLLILACLLIAIYIFRRNQSGLAKIQPRKSGA